MSNIAKILQQSRKNRLLKQAESDPVLKQAREIAEILIGQLIEEKMNEVSMAIANVISDFNKKIEEHGQNVDGKINNIQLKKGDPGDPGEPGEPGYTPIKGKDYFDGEDGKDYILTEKDKKEIAGKIKVPIVEKVIEKTVIEKPTITQVVKEVAIAEEADKIVEKINTTEETIEPKVIKGFKNIITGLQRSIKEKGKQSSGGGMGNVIHESKSISSDTTSVTTNSNIAGGSYAIWAYYQGQMIARGNAYTVSGKTINLLFTPDDGTFIDLIYIRT